MAISEADFRFVADLVGRQLGFLLDKDKDYLVESRFARLAEKLGLAGVGEFITHLRQGVDDGLLSEAVEDMTTNETYFFRDTVPFETLRNQVLPALMAKRNSARVLNIWSAACSTGQEAYSVAMVLREGFPSLADWDVRILCTDVAAKVLERARDGKFNAIEVSRGVSPALLDKYFLKQAGTWQVRDELRKGITFWKMNLCREWPVLPRMDVIFLRNVLIYMDDESKRSILARVHRQLLPDGFLFLGNAETTFNLSDYFARTPWERSGCFRPLAKPAF